MKYISINLSKRKLSVLGGIAVFTVLGASSAPAMAFTQISNIKVMPTVGDGLPQGGKPVLLEAYLATRDPQSNRGNKKANPVGTVGMKFPTGSTVNGSAVGAANICQQSEYTPPANLKSLCAKAQIGVGWALIRGGVPVLQPQIPGAPPACRHDPGHVGDSDLTDQTQFDRTWDKNPAAGPDCIPVGSVYTRIVAYQGGILGSKYWCYGSDWYKRPSSEFKGKACTFRDVNGKAPNVQIKGLDTNGKGKPNSSYRAAGNGCNIIFANDNGVQPLSFAGSANGCSGLLSVVIPALGPSGSGLGELVGGLVLSDFYLRINNKTYLKAGPCPGGSYTVNTHFTYSPLLGENGVLPASNPASKDVNFSGKCRK